MHSFLRVAHSLWAIGVSELAIPWTNYFDDYVAFIITRATINHRCCAWPLQNSGLFAESGDKAPPFAPRVTALGVDLDVSDMHTGVARVDNTESRKSDLIDTLETIRNSGQLPQHQALRLRGKFHRACPVFLYGVLWVGWVGGSSCGIAVAISLCALAFELVSWKNKTSI